MSVDKISGELLQVENDETAKVMTTLCNKIWSSKVWPEDWKTSIFVPLYKKGDKKECSNYRTVFLIPHASKIMLKILQKRLDHFLMPELPDEQAGFKKGRGTRDHIANLRWLMEKSTRKTKVSFSLFH